MYLFRMLCVFYFYEVNKNWYTLLVDIRAYWTYSCAGLGEEPFVPKQPRDI